MNTCETKCSFNKLPSLVIFLQENNKICQICHESGICDLNNGPSSNRHHASIGYHNLSFICVKMSTKQEAAG